MTVKESPSSQQCYGISKVCQALELPRSTFYHRKKSVEKEEPLKKRGPKTAYTDSLLEEKIKHDLENSPWKGEGHRKVWARLRREGIFTSKKRVLRLM